jgi:hypothetical protein
MHYTSLVRVLLLVLGLGSLAVVSTSPVALAASRPHGDHAGATSKLQVEALSPRATIEPAITRLNPAALPINYPSTTLRVEGRGFGEGAVVRWRGFPVPTTRVDDTLLLVTLDRQRLYEPRTLTVTVAISGTTLTSQPVTFTVAPEMPTPPFAYAGSVGGGAITAPVSGTLAYLAEGSQFTILDISMPSVPRRIGGYTTSDVVMDVDIVGTLAYLSLELGGLLILDVGDPTAPRVLSQTDTPGQAFSTLVRDNIAYVCDGFAGLLLLDVSDPARPQQLGRARTDAAYVMDLVGTMAFVSVNSSDQIVRVDVSNPRAPKTLGGDGAVEYGGVYDLQVVGNRVFAATGSDGLTVVQFIPSDVYGPWYWIADYKIAGGARSIRVLDDTAYVTSSRGELLIIDVRDVRQMRLLGSFDTPGRSPDVRIAGNLAYVADGDSLQVLNIANPQAIRHLGSYATWQAEDVAVAPGRAYVASGTSGLRLLDRSTPLAPLERAAVPPLSSAVAVAINGNTAYVANAAIYGPERTVVVSGGLQLIDTTVLTNPVVRANVVITDARQVAVAADRAYVAARDGLYIVDVRDASSPRLLSRIAATPYDGQFYDVQAAAERIYALDRSGNNVRLQIFDVSTPLSPTLLGSITNYDMRRFYVVDGVVYGIDENHRLMLLDVRDAADIKPLGLLDLNTTEYAWWLRDLNDVVIVGNYAILSGNSLNQGGLLFVDLRDLLVPRVVGATELSAYAEGIARDGELLYVAGAEGGLQVRRIRRDLLPATAIVASTGGTLTTIDGSMTLTVAPNTLSSTLLLTYTGLLTPTQPMTNVTVLRSFVLEGRTGSDAPIARFSPSLSLTLRYSNTQEMTLNRQGTAMQLVRWDGTSWQLLPSCATCSSSGAGSQLTVLLDRLGEFALVNGPVVAPRRNLFLPLTQGGYGSIQSRVGGLEQR